VGITDAARRLRLRARRAWSAWRSEPASEATEAQGQAQGEVEVQNQALAAAHKEFRRQLGLSAEDLDAEAREELLARVQQDTEEQFDLLSECMRGGNGQS